MSKETYKNRYGDVFTFTPDEDGNILWEGDFKYCRYGFEETPDNLNMVDPSGGPYINVGMDMKHIHNDFKNMIVEEIINVDKGYKLIIRK